MAKINLDYQNKATQIIKQYTLYSAGSGFIPVIGLDVLATTALQMEMTRKLCQLYHLKYEEGQVRNFVNCLVGTVFARISAAGTKSFLKMIPGVGAVVD